MIGESLTILLNDANKTLPIIKLENHHFSPISYKLLDRPKYYARYNLNINDSLRKEIAIELGLPADLKDFTISQNCYLETFI